MASASAAASVAVVAVVSEVVACKWLAGAFREGELVASSFGAAGATAEGTRFKAGPLGFMAGSDLSCHIFERKDLAGTRGVGKEHTAQRNSLEARKEKLWCTGVPKYGEGWLLRAFDRLAVDFGDRRRSRACSNVIVASEFAGACHLVWEFRERYHASRQ